jgi:O-antigen/teichoic acid export membrane protein
MLREILASRRKIVSIGLPALIGQGTAAAWGIVTIYVARVLPSDAYAAYSVARSVEFFAALLGGGFVLQALLKFASEGTGPREKKLVNAGSLLTAGLAVFGAAALALGGGLLQSFYGNLQLGGIPGILALMVLAEAMCAIPKNVLFARQRTKTVMWGDLTAFVLRSGIVVFLAATGRLRTSHAIFGAQALSSVASTLVLIYLGGRFGESGAGATRESFRQILRFSVFTLGSSLASFVYTWTDILMLGKLAPPDQVSAYGVCRSLAAFAVSLNAAANIILLPLASRMTSQSRSGVIQRTWQGIAIITAILLPFTIIVVLFPVPILQLLFDGKYNYASPVLVALCLINLIRPVGSLFSATAAGVGKPLYSLISVATSAVLNIVLNAVLIPPYGGLGAAIATAISMAGGGAAIVLMVSAHVRRKRIVEIGEVPTSPLQNF